MKGILSASMPGLLDGWKAAHGKYGVLKWGEVFEPAIDLAANGFPVSNILSRDITADPPLRSFPRRGQYSRVKTGDHWPLVRPFTRRTLGAPSRRSPLMEPRRFTEAKSPVPSSSSARSREDC